MNAQIKAAEARLDELTRELERIGGRMVEAAEKLEEAEADLRNHSELLDAANQAYSDDPNDGNAAAISKARDALHLASLRRNKPRAEYAALQAEHEACRVEYVAAGLECEKARLRERSSLETYQARTAAPFKTLLAALAAIPAAAAAIDNAFDDANAAARELGQDELSVFHRVAPFLRSAADVHGASGLVSSGNFYRAAGVAAHGLARALSLQLIESITVCARSSGGVVQGAAAEDLLERVLACRTSTLAVAMVLEAEEKAALEAPVPAAPARDHEAWLAEQRRLAGPKGTIGTEKPKSSSDDGEQGDAEEFERVANAGLAIIG